MAKKTVIKSQPLSAAQRRVIAQASRIGYDASGGFEAAVMFLAKHKPQGDMLNACGVQYKAGYIVRYRENRDRAYSKRTHNQPLEVKAEAALDIYAKSHFDAKAKVQKKGARTEEEQRMCKAADSSWSLAKGRAGLTVIAKRKAKTTTVPDETPKDLTLLRPKFADKAAANDFFQNMAVALLATCDENNSRSKAKIVIPQITSAVSDFQAAIKAALGIK